MTASGAPVLPAPMRSELGIEPGSELVARVDGDAIMLEPAQAAIQRLRALFAHVREDVSLAEQLIAERRAEARREAGE